MTKEEKYEKIIIEYLKKFVETHQSKRASTLHRVIIDKENKRYLVVFMGTQNNHYVYGMIFHLEIIDGKVWFMHNGTDILIDEELIKRGIPKKDMWIAFNPDYANKYAGYGVEETELVEN